MVKLFERCSVDITSITIGEALELRRLLAGVSENAGPHPFVGKYCIARCYSAGVHAGEVVSVDGDKVVLRDSRRLWSWKAKSGVALSGVAQTGIQPGCKIDVVNPEIYLTGVIELIPTTVVAKESINEAK